MSLTSPLVRLAVVVLLGLSSGAATIRAASCTDAACVQVSGRLASIDTNRSILLNALIGRMLDSNVSLTVGDWQYLASADINLLKILQAVQADATLASPTEAFNTSVSAASFFQATANALQANGQTQAAAAMIKLAGQTNLGTIRLADLIDLCATCSSYSDVTLNVLDLVGGTASLFNYQNVLFTPTPVTITGSALGILSIGNILLYVQVCEPPRIVCGQTGAQFYGATIRLKLDLDLASVDLTSALGSLGIASLHAQLTHLTVFAVVARAQGTIQSIDALASAVTVQARPGVVDVYVGSMSDNVFFNRTHTINPATELDYGTVGALQLTVLGIPITASVRAKAWTQGEAPFNSNLNFNGPYPQKKTAITNASFVTNLISTLLTSLSLDIEVNGLGALSGLVTAALNTLLGTIKPVLTTVIRTNLLTPLGLVLNSIVNPMLAVLGVRLGEADVVVLGAHRNCSYTVSGTVYRDANRNGFKDGSEAGTSLVLYAKLVDSTSPAGPALQQVTVNPTTGVFSFSGVVTGSYRIVLSANNTLGDVTPVTVPTGWTMTEQPTRIRLAVVATADLPEQNFGYAPFSSVAGQVFLDAGNGGGTANDSVRNGTESGLGGVTIRLLDNTNAVIDTTQTAADGTYQVYLPASLANGAVLRVIETNLNNGFSTGGSAGTTGGSYQLATDTVTFTYASGASYTGVNFADVPVAQLTSDGQQSTLPGTTVYYAHQFIAGTGGQVQFSIAHTLTPVVEGWSETLYHDANGNGQVDAAEQVLSSATTVIAGQVVNLVVKVFAPAAAPNAAHDQAVLSALFTFTGAVSPLSVTLTRTDLTIIGGTATAGLKLVKTVDKALARPGDTITYTITFTNEAAGPLQNVVVTDATPVFTRFASASTGILPVGFTLTTLTKPAVGATGALSWSFLGPLLPAATSTVTFAVVVDQ